MEASQPSEEDLHNMFVTMKGTHDALRSVQRRFRAKVVLLLFAAVGSGALIKTTAAAEEPTPLLLWVLVCSSALWLLLLFVNGSFSDKWSGPQLYVKRVNKVLLSFGVAFSPHGKQFARLPA